MFIYKIYAKTYKNVSQSVISSDLKEDRQKAAIMQTLDRLLSISVRCALVDLLCLCAAFFFLLLDLYDVTESRYFKYGHMRKML